MADGISIAASAIQVADTGFKLFGALSQYIKDLRDANKHHKQRLADEVRTTAWALQQLGSLLEQDQDLELCKPEVLTETHEALKGSQTVLDEVRSIINNASTPSSSGSGMALAERLKWPLKKGKVQVMLAQLERLKTTLLLVFKVLSYASKIAARSTGREMILLDEKRQLTYLVKAKQEAVIHEQKLLAAERAPTTRSSRPTSPSDEPDVRSRPIAPARLGTSAEEYGLMGLAGIETGSPPTIGSVTSDNPGANTLTPPTGSIDPHANDLPVASRVPSNPPLADHLFVGPATMPPLPGHTFPWASTPTKSALENPVANLTHSASGRHSRLGAQLGICAAAVGRYSSTFERAKTELDVQNTLGLQHITKSFRAVRRAVDNLVTMDWDVDSDSADSDGATQAFNASSHLVSGPREFLCARSPIWPPPAPYASLPAQDYYFRRFGHPIPYHLMHKEQNIAEEVASGNDTYIDEQESDETDAVDLINDLVKRWTTVDAEAYTDGT